MEEDKRAFSRIEPYLHKAFEKNREISDEFRELAEECFGRIFNMLGERNFRRWLVTKNLDMQIRKIVIQCFDEKDKILHPNTSGYFKKGTSEIKLKLPDEGLSSTRKKSLKATNIHETFHLITDHKDKKDNFEVFLNEGLTEYMKGLAYDSPNSYRNNVKTVEFLHSVFGDSLIKAYLLGKGKFDDKFLSIINYDGNASKEDIEKFYSTLTNFHIKENAELDYITMKYNSEKYTPEQIAAMKERYNTAKDSYNETKDIVPQIFQKLIVGTISKKLNDFEYYQNGELNLRQAYDQINTLISNCNISTFNQNISDIGRWQEETFKLAIEQIVEKTHLLVPYEGEERVLKKQEFINAMMPNFQIKENGFSKTSPKFYYDEEIFLNEHEDIAGKLFENTIRSYTNRRY